MKTKLLGVVGSLNRESLSRCAVSCVLKKAGDLGAEVELLDLRETPLPIFCPNNRQNPEYLHALKKVDWANTLLISSPDYHGGMSGVLKNFLDYFWKEFAGKLFGYICASHEKGLTAMDQMRTTIRQCYGWSLPYGISVTSDDLDPHLDQIKNPRIAQRLDLLAYDLTTYGKLLRKQFVEDLANPHPHTGFAAHYRPKSVSEK